MNWSWGSLTWSIQMVGPPSALSCFDSLIIVFAAAIHVCRVNEKAGLVKLRERKDRWIMMTIDTISGSSQNFCWCKISLG